jgi:hypothetical protein
VFARKFSPRTGFYTDLVIFHDKKARIAIEIKWGKKRISKKDRRLTKARNPLSREDVESHFKGELSKK